VVAALKLKLGKWSPWIAIALVAVVGGLLLPQLLPGEPAVEKARIKGEAKGKPGTEYVAPAIPDVPNPQAMLFRLAAGTMVVLGLSVASIWGMRHWLQPRAGAGGGQRALRLIETLHLGSRCSLHLVHLGKREILVGMDGAGIKTVVPLSKPFDDVLAETEATDAAEPATIPLPARAA
jgi:flagellar biogenesis protein FliO